METHYDWTAVMKKVLGACGVGSCLDNIKAKCEEEVTDWLYMVECPVPRVPHSTVVWRYYR